MLIVYDSFTNNVKRFVQKLDYPSVSVNEIDKIQENYILVTRSFGQGEVPKTTSSFLERHNNYEYMVGVACSGNIVWKDKYGAAGRKISSSFNVPLLHVFELSGTTKDVEKFNMEVSKFV